MDYVVNENKIILEIEPKVKTMSDAIVDRLIHYKKIKHDSTRRSRCDGD